MSNGYSTKKQRGLGSATNHTSTENFRISIKDPCLKEARELTCQGRTTLAKLAAPEERSAKKNPVAAQFLERRKHRDDYLRAQCVCSVCGGKGLYYMLGKMYCKKDVHIGVAAQKKKWTPQAKGKN